MATEMQMIPQMILRQIVPLGDERTDLYRSSNLAMRWVFWGRLRTISRLIRRSGVHGACLDFGGGTGMLLPTLSNLFLHVTCIDIDTKLARRVVTKFELSNVDVIEKNVADEATQTYDAIVAADVLEHFADLEMPIDAIKRRLKCDGWLFTSCPTENWLYRALRVVLRKTKPVDHYQTAYEVESQLIRAGFVRELHSAHPCVLTSLFLISGWRYRGDHA